MSEFFAGTLTASLLIIVGHFARMDVISFSIGMAIGSAIILAASIESKL